MLTNLIVVIISGMCKSNHYTVHLKHAMKVKVAQPCPTLRDPMDSRVHGILQARILEWLAFPFFRGSSQPGDRIGLRHCRQIFFQLSHKGSPRILEWVAYPFSSRSSQPRKKLGSPALQVDSLLTYQEAHI